MSLRSGTGRLDAQTRFTTVAEPAHFYPNHWTWPRPDRWGFERGESSLFEGGRQFRRALIDHDSGHADAAITDI